MRRARHPGTHPEVDEGVLLVAAFRRIDVEADTVGRGDAELVFAGIGCEHGAGPIDAELRGISTLLGSLVAEVEVDDRVDLLLEGDLGPVAIRHLGVALRTLAIDGRQPARLGRTGGATERPEQVGDALAVLADGEVGEFDPRRMVPRAGLGGVEGLMDMLGDGGGVGHREGAGIVLRHLTGDVLGQGRDRLLPDKGLVRLAGDAFARRPMAAHAILTVDGFAGPGRGQVLLMIALTLAAGEGEDGHADDGESDLDGPGNGHGVMTLKDTR